MYITGGVVIENCYIIDIFHTPEEALVEDRVKACVREEIVSVIEKIGPLCHIYNNEGKFYLAQNMHGLHEN